MNQDKKRSVGRPKGMNVYGEATKPMRIPMSKIQDVLTFLQGHMPSFELPLYASTVSAGFPSPADDYIENKLDLNTHLIKHPSATFFLKVSGDSMKNAGIQSGDMLIVDKSLQPTDGKVVIAAVEGELTVKRLSLLKGRVKLIPENNSYPVIDITDSQELVIWGVVTYVIHAVR